ncbi:MAG: AAA family ATPase [Aureibaculum sp.]
MLASLSIKNFAIIDNLHVNFEEGFSIITGETGAGKSILLGGLALILGKRADLSSLKIREKKCIIEGEFIISKYDLQDLFDEHDLDFEERTIIRREILPNGKSRAFINDTPTTLSILASLSEKLIDVHSQHQTLELADINYQYLIIDALANNDKYLRSYKKGLNIYKRLNNELNALLNKQQEEATQYEYNAYLLKELIDADFKPDEQNILEDTLEKLNHVEEIKLYLVEAKQLFEQEEIGISDQLNKYAGILTKLSKFSNGYQDLCDRLNSLKIEIDDITQ